MKNGKEKSFILFVKHYKDCYGNFYWSARVYDCAQNGAIVLYCKGPIYGDDYSYQVIVKLREIGLVSVENNDVFVHIIHIPVLRREMLKWGESDA